MQYRKLTWRGILAYLRVLHEPSSYLKTLQEKEPSKLKRWQKVYLYITSL